MLEFYPNAETVSSVVARFERFADCYDHAISRFDRLSVSDIAISAADKQLLRTMTSSLPGRVV
jgi:hypothetical protein